MYKVLISARSFKTKAAVEYLEQYGCQLAFAAQGHLQSDDLKEMISGYDALICGIDQVTAEVIEAADRLKVICMHGTGVDHIDVQAAKAKGIYVVNAPGTNSNAVAELTVGLMISAARYIPAADASVRGQGWQRRVGTEISGKTVGLIGLGWIGKRVAELLSGFGVNYLAYDLTPDPDFAKRFSLRYVSLAELLSQADIISLHIPLSEETRGLIGADEFAVMKKNAIIINTARGALIDEQALYEALKEQRIAGAALDAFASEPLDNESPLRSLDNIVLTPHIAASSVESAEQVDMVNARSVVDVLNGLVPQTVITR